MSENDLRSELNRNDEEIKFMAIWSSVIDYSISKWTFQEPKNVIFSNL
jgi:hypothetical protein